MSHSLIFCVPANNTGRSRQIDLRDHKGLGFDEILEGIVSAVSRYFDSGYWTAKSAESCILSMKADFLPWLAGVSKARGEELYFSSVDRGLLNEFVTHVKSTASYTSAAIKYKEACRAFSACEEIGLIQGFSSVRPIRPFPSVAAHTEHTRPYSKREKTLIVRALTEDIEAIRNGGFKGSDVDKVSAYFLMIQLRTGFNSSSLIELSRSALIDHPLRPGYKLLVAYKERAKKEVAAPVKWHENIGDSAVCQQDVARLYEELLDLTNQWSVLMKGVDRAFLRPPVRGSKGAKATPVELTSGDVRSFSAKRLSLRHKLIDDSGKMLTVTGRRMRVTLAERALELSDGDPFVVAKLLGNSISVASQSYMEPSTDAIAQFSTAIEEFASKLGNSQTAVAQKTPVGACNDPLQGKYAPKDGVTLCERWLQCFRCPNQCLTGDVDDLWRLYSFYWLLLKKSRVMRASALSGMFRFVIRIMEGPIVDKYGKAAIAARERARSSPHPFWAIANSEDWLNVE